VGESRKGGGVGKGEHEALAETVSSGEFEKTAASAPLPKVGDRFANRYDLQAELGRGASGVVFRAHDVVADHTVAIKILSRRAIGSSQGIARIRRELHAALKITHPGVVRIHDLIDAEANLALSMELVAGGTLQERLRRQPPLTPAEIVNLFRDLVRGLAAAHKAGVVHRDLKPANVILRAETGRPVITDFGLSRHGAVDLPPASGPSSPDPLLTREGDMLGTPLYMAPEQMLGREVGPAADVYSLGVVMFEAATGKSPHEADSVPDLLDARLHKPAPLLSPLRPDLPAWVSRVVERCLRPDQRTRYASAVELRGDIDKALGEASATGPVKALAAPRSRAWRWLALLPLLVASVWALVWWWRGRLPAHDRRVAIAVRNEGGADDAWIAPALRRIAVVRLRENERRVRVADPSDANIDVELSYRREGDGVTIAAVAGPHGGRQRQLAATHADSVVAALDKLWPQLIGFAADGQPEQPPDAAQLAAMMRLGTQSPVAFRHYQSAVRGGWGAVATDMSAVAADIEAALHTDPGWAHAYALWAANAGFGSPKAREIIERAGREVTNRNRDPIGAQLIDAIRTSQHGDHAAAARALDELYSETPDDVIVGWQLLLELDAQQRALERLGVCERLYQLRPDLQFGVDMERGLRDLGRGSEVEKFQREWMQRAPENEQAIAAQVAIDLEQGRDADAARHARDVMVLYGPAPQRLAMLADVLLVLGDYAEARRIAAGLLRGGPIDRARGHRRIGEIAILEGNFAIALDAFQRARTEGTPIGFEAEIVPTLEALRSVADIVGESEEATRATRELAQTLRDVGFTGLGALAQYEARLRAAPKGRCPNPADDLRDVPAGAARDIARRNMQRLAAGRGCASCADVVRAGLSLEERTTRSLYAFGVCAENSGALTLAGDAFAQAQHISPPTLDSAGNVPSTVHAILARYHGARLLERQGKIAQARAGYADVLRHWGHSDRTLEVVEQTRAAMARLRDP
jgi:tetratricopeptide (TPR) repeat protein